MLVACRWEISYEWPNSSTIADYAKSLSADYETSIFSSPFMTWKVFWAWYVISVMADWSLD